MVRTDYSTDDWFDYNAEYSPTHLDYWLDPHPKTETQLNRQNFIKKLWFVGSWYSDYLEERSKEEMNRNTMELYDVKFSDVKYPHLAGLYQSGSSSGTLANAGWQYSKNLSRLYGRK